MNIIKLNNNTFMKNGVCFEIPSDIKVKDNNKSLKIICHYTNKELKVGDKTKYRGYINGEPYWNDNSKQYDVSMRNYNLKRFYGRYRRCWETYVISVSCIGKVVKNDIA